jgi:hypothetical protein
MPQLIKYESFEELKTQSNTIVLSKKQQKEAFADYENMLTFFKKHIISNNQVTLKAKKVTKSDK